MRWGIDSSIFIHLDFLGERKGFHPEDLVLILLEFCEKVGGNLSEIHYIGRQVENTKTVRSLADTGLVTMRRLDEIYSDDKLSLELEALVHKLKKIKKNHPEYSKYRELKKYLSHFQSEEFDIYDICFFLAHRDNRIDFSLLCDEILFLLLITFGYRSYLCKEKPPNPRTFLSSANCKPKL